MKAVATLRRPNHSETVKLVENDEGCLLSIVAVKGNLDTLITDPDVCTDILTQRLDSTSKSNRLFPCRSNDEVRAALPTILGSPRIGVEVAGGILRHHMSW